MKISQKKKQYKVRDSRLYDPSSREPFELSRSKIEDFLNCPRCFYMDRRLGVAKPDTPPFQINKAVDELLKKEFDVYRERREPHPIMKQHGIDAVPFAHADLGSWRNNFKGIRYLDPATNFLVFGSIDDVWQKKDGELIVLDYKATWTTKDASLEDDWKQSWKRQLEVYQWLFRKNGFKVSDNGYFIWCNVDSDVPAFKGVLKFKIEVWPYKGDGSWVEPALVEARKCLASEKIPAAAPACDYCAYKKGSAELAASQGK